MEYVASLDVVGKIGNVDVSTVVIVVNAGEFAYSYLISQLQCGSELIHEVIYPSRSVRLEDRYDLSVRISLAGGLKCDLYLGRMMSIVINVDVIPIRLDLESSLDAFETA